MSKIYSPLQSNANFSLTPRDSNEKPRRFFEHAWKQVNPFFNRVFGLIGIRGKLMFLIGGIILSASLLSWKAFHETIDFFEKREKVDLKDESSFSRMKLELMIAEFESNVKEQLSHKHWERNKDDQWLDVSETKLPEKSKSNVPGDRKGLVARYRYFENHTNFLLKSKDQVASGVRKELRELIADRLGDLQQDTNQRPIWSGMYWTDEAKSSGQSSFAKMQLLVPDHEFQRTGIDDKRAKVGTDEGTLACGWWLVELNVTEAVEKNLKRSPREYIFLVNPGAECEMAFSPFGNPNAIPYQRRSEKTFPNEKNSIRLRTAKQLKQAIESYDDTIRDSDITAAESAQRAGVEFPEGLIEGTASNLRLNNLLESDTDLSFLESAWFCQGDLQLSEKVARQLSGKGILEPVDELPNSFDPLRRLTENTGKKRDLNIRARSAVELEVIKKRLSLRLDDLAGGEVPIIWKTAKKMDGLVMNVAAIHSSGAKPTDRPVLYYARAVAIDEIRGAASEGLYPLINRGYLLAVIAIVIAALLAFYITRPLIMMTQTVNEISKVGLTDAIESDKVRRLLDQLPVHKHGEVGSLALQFQKTFHEMLNQLRFKVKAEQEIRSKAEESNRSKQKEKDAIEESQAKSQFLAMISHDMRQPLHMIFTELQLMMKQNLSSYQATKANAILTSARRLKNLIQDILDYQRYMADDLAIEPVEVEVQGFLQSVAEQFSHSENDTGNKLNVVCNFDRTIFVDQPKLERILVNLLSNAFKFTDAGTITLQADLLRGNLIQFVVQDTGRGISPDKKEKIFSIQQTAKQKGNLDGTGLGLYICNLLVQNMKGDIQFESKVGVGTTFTITLPTDFLNGVPDRDKNNSGSRDSKRHLEESNKDGITVLIIDDQAESRQSIRESLPAHYKSIEAANGEEGIRLALEHLPDAITLDVEMPGMDGWKVLSELQKNTITAGIPVVMVTVHPTENKAAVLGANGFVSKPFDPAELSSTIRRSLIEKVGATVMVVEDDSDTRRDLKQCLESSGWKVVTAVDGEDAMNLIQSQLPSLFIVDLYMPNMDGFALIEKLRSMNETEHIPIVVLSAACLTEDERRFLDPRIDRYFGKGSSDLNTIQDEIERLVYRGGVVESSVDH